MHTSAGCSSSRLGTRVGGRRSATSLPAANAAKTPSSSSGPGAASNASTSAGSGWPAAASRTRRSSSPARASSPASSGRSPPTSRSIRGYEQALRTRILPDLGAAKLSQIERGDVQDLADRLLGQGLDPSTIRNAIMPLRVIYRRAVARGDVTVNPTTAVELPAVRGTRDRIASPEEAAALLAALPDEERALWASALYAGLRCGELMALAWEHVDLAAGVIRVERSYDPKAQQFVAPKSRAGTRKVPIAAALREHLIAHKLRAGRADGLVFGRSASLPFDPWQSKARADRAWKAAGLAPIGLHESRHTFASLMIGAGVNAKALATYMGHASITITLDRYGHLMPGNEEQAAGLLDDYLSRSREARHG